MDKQNPELAEHLVALPDGQWALWRCVCLRGAGFNATQPLTLGAPECGAKADEVIEAQDQAERARRKAMMAVKQDMYALRLGNGNKDRKRQERIAKAIKLISVGKAPEVYDSPNAGAKQVVAMRAAIARLDSARDSFRKTFDASLARTSEVIEEVARSERFREAVTWQNRHAIHASIDALLRMPLEGSSRNAERRKREELVASYLQRYCVKNDTIGFFGPVGWAEIVPQGEAISVRPGPNLLSAHRVCFETWCVDVLAEVLIRDKALLPWVPPRRVPFFHLEGTTIYSPSGPPAKLSAEQAILLRACDGERTAKEIAQELIRSTSASFKNEMDVYKMLEDMGGRALISWALELPVESYPERTLRKAFERISDESLRSSVLGTLSEIEAGLHRVAHAGNDAGKLDKAIGELEATFTRVTGIASTRSAGRMYAGRTLVYEDCRRDIEIEIGPEILRSLGPPLSLLLASARWFTLAVAAIYGKAFKRIYDRLAREAGSTTVNLVDFWQSARPLILDDEKCLAHTLIPIFQERWANILSIPDGQRRVSYSSETLRPRVLAAFNASRPGWKFARYHSPDVMIAASSAEAIRRGDYQFVLGELHIGTNTLGAPVFLDQHPTPEKLYRAVDLDLPEPRLVAATPKHWPSASSRLQYTLLSTKDFRLDIAPGVYRGSASQGLPIGSLVVEERCNTLIARTRDGRTCFDIIEVCADVLRGQVANCFKLLRPGNHMPRVTFDNLVVCRESWCFPPSEIEFAFEKDEADRSIGARRWSRQQGMPRFVFVKSPVEVKPFYLDFESPIYVDIFAKIVRKAAENSLPGKVITLSEMLPTHDQAWLPDAKGQTYTSEFRIVAVDLAGRQS